MKFQQYVLQFLLSVSLFICLTTTVTAQEFTPFITSWVVETGDLEISIPMIGNGYDFTIDWGDGSSMVDYATNPGDGVEHSLSHAYSVAGTYSVSISGSFPRIYINNKSSIREKITDVTQWGDVAWESMEMAFYGARRLVISADDAPDLSGVSSMRQMFRQARNLNGNIGHWNTETVTDMNGLFWNAVEFNNGIGSWNTAMVTDMMNMFDGAETFNRDIGGWNTGNVETMQAMFRGTKAFSQSLNGWNTGNVINMSRMFNNAEAFNGDIGEWNTGSVETMRNMFGTARVLNQNIGGWVTDNVTDMALMFTNTDEFNADIGGWNTSKVKTMQYMFQNSGSFNQDLSNWDVSGVTNMGRMFLNAESYNRSLGNWAIGALDPTEFLGSMTEMLNNTGMSTNTYDATLAGWAAFVDENNGPANIELGADGLTYCSGAVARQSLIDDYNWVITGDAQTEPCDDPGDLPGIPSLTAPINNAADVALPVILQWDAAANADVYNLQIALDDEFNMIAIEADSIADTIFEVAELEVGSNYYWRVNSHGSGETSSWSAVWSFEVSTSTSNPIENEIPTVPELQQNYPNPFNPSTEIGYSLPEVSDVRLEVFNMLGQRVSLLMDGRMHPGLHTVSFQAGSLTSGIYIYRLSTGDFTITRKMTLLK